MKKIIFGIVAAVVIAVPALSTAPAASAGTAVVTSERTFSETQTQRQARLKAREYVDYTAFSRSGLIEQLKFEGFRTRAAIYGVDSIRVSWYRQAVLKAKDYLDYTAFSRSGLIDQLVFEGFTRAQAVYGVNRTGL